MINPRQFYAQEEAKFHENRSRMVIGTKRKEKTEELLWVQFQISKMESSVLQQQGLNLTLLNCLPKNG